jgi:hypothetical protein
MRKLFLLSTVLLIGALPANVTADTWRLDKISETKLLTRNRFYLNTVADLNGNGITEIVAADFGMFGATGMEGRREHDRFNLFVLEWNEKAQNLALVFEKRWDWSSAKTSDERDRYFSAWNAERLVVVSEQGQRGMVESTPPYIAIEWKDSRYVLHEQHYEVYLGKATSLGFPWLSSRCGRSYDRPHECLLAIRRFDNDATPYLVTRWSVHPAVLDRSKDIDLLRVRRWAPGFPIIWEKKMAGLMGAPGEAYREGVSGGTALFEHAMVPGESKAKMQTRSYYLDRSTKSGEFELTPIEAKFEEFQSARWSTKSTGYPDLLIGYTRGKTEQEFWGYGSEMVKAKSSDDHFYNYYPVRIALRADRKSWVKEALRYPTHENWNGTGQTVIADIDGDGIDEVLLIEETGKREWEGYMEKRLVRSDIKDHIRILKWNGSTYESAWTSPPITTYGTKLIVADVRNNGRKQLVVLNGNGRIEVWEKH